MRGVVPLVLCLAACGDPPTGSARTIDAVRTEKVIARASADLTRDPGMLQRLPTHDGTVKVQVAAGFRHATLAVRDANGVVRSHCTDRPEIAARLLREGAE